MTNPTLPAWAKIAPRQEAGFVSRVDVDAGAMYAAWLAELAANPVVPVPQDQTAADIAASKPPVMAMPSEFGARTVQIRNAAEGARQGSVDVPAMTEADGRCDPAKPTRYWLEVAFQCMKLELQVAMRGHGFEIRVHDTFKVWAHSNHPEGRGLVAATWGKEAREHFRRLRGFVP